MLSISLSLYLTILKAKQVYESFNKANEALADNARSRKAKEVMKTKKQDTEKATELQIDTNKEIVEDKEEEKAQSKNQDIEDLAKYANATEKEMKVGEMQMVLQLGESITGIFVFSIQCSPTITIQSNS